MDFVHTPPKKKVLRAILGVLLFAAIFSSFQFMGNPTEELTEFVVHHALPMLVSPFIVYGPFLNFCQYVKLVDIDAGDE